MEKTNGHKSQVLVVDYAKSNESSKTNHFFEKIIELLPETVHVFYGQKEITKNKLNDNIIHKLNTHSIPVLDNYIKDRVYETLTFDINNANMLDRDIVEIIINNQKEYFYYVKWLVSSGQKEERFTFIIDVTKNVEIISNSNILMERLIRSKSKKKITNIIEIIDDSEFEMQRREILTDLININETHRLLNSIKATLINENSKLKNNKLNSLIKAISKNQKETEQWKKFHEHLNTYNSGFYHDLSSRYPQLTPAEIKIISLIKMQLDNNEIASLLDISRRTVETHRLRIRKKLKVDNKQNLGSFLLNLS